MRNKAPITATYRTSLAAQKIKTMSTQNFPLRGYVFILIAVIFWGGSASFAKFLFTKQYDTLIIVQTRSSLSFILLALYFALKGRNVFRIRLQDLPLFASVGLIGIAGTNFTYYYTVKESTVATAILVQNTAPVFVMMYAVLVSKEEEFNETKAISLLLALFGCYVAVSGGSVADIKLSGWALLTGPVSTLCYVFVLIAGKRILRHYSTWTMLLYAFGFAAIFWLFINPPWTIASKGYTVTDWGVFWVFAIVSILIPYSFFSTGLKMLDASTVGILSTMEPIAAIVIAFFVLGETLNAIQILGAVAVVAAVGMLQVRQEHIRKFIRRDIDAK